MASLRSIISGLNGGNSVEDKIEKTLNRVHRDKENSESNRLIYDVSKLDTVIVENDTVDENLIEKEYKLRQDLHYFLQNSLYKKMKFKLPRSEFAGIREHMLNRKVKRTYRLKRSLELKNIDFNHYKIELDGSKLGYPDLINRENKYITYKYWDKMSVYASDEIYEHLKKKESILNITVRKG